MINITCCNPVPPYKQLQKNIRRQFDSISYELFFYSHYTKLMGSNETTNFAVIIYDIKYSL